MTDFDAYQEWTRTTAVYPVSTKIEELSYLALGLNGEAGEVADKVKRILRDRDDGADPITAESIAYELGDVLWYLARLADALGFGLSEIAVANQYKLMQRLARGTLKGSGDNR